MPHCPPLYFICSCIVIYSSGFRMLIVITVFSCVIFIGWVSCSSIMCLINCLLDWEALVSDKYPCLVGISQLTFVGIWVHKSSICSWFSELYVLHVAFGDSCPSEWCGMCLYLGICMSFSVGLAMGSMKKWLGVLVFLLVWSVSTTTATIIQEIFKRVVLITVSEIHSIIILMERKVIGWIKADSGYVKISGDLAN